MGGCWLLSLLLFLLWIFIDSIRYRSVFFMMMMETSTSVGGCLSSNFFSMILWLNWTLYLVHTNSVWFALLRANDNVNDYKDFSHHYSVLDFTLIWFSSPWVVYFALVNIVYFYTHEHTNTNCDCDSIGHWSVCFMCMYWAITMMSSTWCNFFCFLFNDHLLIKTHLYFTVIFFV